MRHVRHDRRRHHHRGRIRRHSATPDGSVGTIGDGCTDSDAANFDASATRDNGSCKYFVTFSVDMSRTEISPESVVHVSGNFEDELGQSEWCGRCHPMTRGTDDVWSLTVSLPPGTFEHKFQVDGWTMTEEAPTPAGFAPGSS